MANKVQIGDVVELTRNSKYYYIQFIGVHPEYAETIAVFPFAQDFPVRDVRTLFQSSSVYPIFYPLKLSLRQSLGKVIGNCAPSMAIPKTLRRPGRIDPGPVVVNWFIDEEEGTRIASQLSVRELEIPIAAIVNFEMLITRIDQKWHPRMYT